VPGPPLRDFIGLLDLVVRLVQERLHNRNGVLEVTLAKVIELVNARTGI
jgi:hypothetical protein